MIYVLNDCIKADYTSLAASQSTVALYRRRLFWWFPRSLVLKINLKMVKYLRVVKLTVNREATTGQFWKDELLIARHLETAASANLLRNVDIARPFGNILSQTGGAAGVASGATILNVNVHCLKIVNIFNYYHVHFIFVQKMASTEILHLSTHMSRIWTRFYHGECHKLSRHNWTVATTTTTKRVRLCVVIGYGVSEHSEQCVQLKHVWFDHGKNGAIIEDDDTDQNDPKHSLFPR